MLAYRCKDHAFLTRNPGHLTIAPQRGTIRDDVEHDAYCEGTRAQNIFVIPNPLTPSSDFSLTLAVSTFEPIARFQQVELICEFANRRAISNAGMAFRPARLLSRTRTCASPLKHLWV